MYSRLLGVFAGAIALIPRSPHKRDFGAAESQSYSVVQLLHCGTNTQKAVRPGRTATLNSHPDSARRAVPRHYCSIETTIIPLGFAFAITGTALSPFPLSMV